ncbi:SDR family NAD(P)-dependent oxidoreductase [Lysobacter sp. cf310]|uniref:SDR family NAD(P)-dependent oxidoreductase n=1 Tax=Lysobacter sp. cf310 TaxID=1761790 RepID=UPI0008EB2E91|nr:SDR family NAD(P)-dependent oxidoreductase [Lysobacter sp. cf310]SFK54869.1 NADP-dependent 3-hydroxy acid dehydrogenase YdfG [Lysobacter sp. cf310]
MSSQVWLVTGSSRGLGRQIVEAALAAGERVVATARDPDSLADLVARYPGQVRAVALDVTDATAARAAVQTAIEAYGRLDVLVNNAGYGELAPFEQTDEAAFRAQIDTNFYGVVNLTRAALPVMRSQRGGRILQISSVGGRIGAPGLSAYQAAKWAVGGFSEALSQEVAPFGIRISVLEPGGMRTGWGEIASRNLPEIWPDYRPSVGALAELLSHYLGNENGDPAKVALAVLTVARMEDPPLHLLLGSDALHYVDAAESARAAQAQRWRELSMSIDHAAPTIPSLPQA